MHERAAGQPPPLTRAGRGRHIIHLTIATAGWILFGWWWWLVLRRVTDREIRFTIALILASLVVVLVITSLWVLHNLRIARLGRRTGQRAVRIDARRDYVGRQLLFDPLDLDIRVAPAMRVRIDGADKIYEVHTIRRETTV